MAPAQSKRQSRKRRAAGARGAAARLGSEAGAAGAAEAAGARGAASAGAAGAASRLRPVSTSVASSPGKRGDRRGPPARSASSGQGLNWQSTLGAYGERPPSLFGGLPVSEVAIFMGAIAAAIGFFAHKPGALIVGLVVCTLGVLEVTAREHFSGYRSHAALLAAVPSIGIGIGVVSLIGHGSVQRGLEGQSRTGLVAIVPVFALLYVWLRKRFRTARQARIVRPPGV